MQKLKFYLKILISFLLLFYLVYIIELEKIFESLKDISFLILVLAVFLCHIDWFLAAGKLQLFLRTSFVSTLRLQYISMLYSFILPGQLAGEGYKLIKISREIGYARGTSIIVVDRITGFLGIVFLAFIGILFSTIEISLEIYIILIFLCLTFLAPLLLTQPTKSAFEWVTDRKLPFISRHSPKIIRLLEEWILLQRQKVLFLFNLILGILFQLLAIFINYYVGQSLGIDISLFDWFWIFGFISLALFLPITYAGLGIREGSMVALLGIFGVGADKAIALSFLILAFQLTGVLVGFIWNIKKEKLPDKV